MRGTVLPITLLCSALGLALGSTATWIGVVGIVVLICTAATVSVALTSVGIDPGWADGVYLACWITVAGSALSVYLPRPVGVFAVVVLALNAGIYGGWVSALTGSPQGLWEGLPGLVMLLPAGWMAQRNLRLPLKVVSSWLVAIAALAAIVQFLPVTPGYLPDHVE
jgi:hypothetical protein